MSILICNINRSAYRKLTQIYIYIYIYIYYKLGWGTFVIKYSFGFVSCGPRVAPYPQALFYEAVYFYLKNISTVKNFVQKIINYRDIKYVINNFFNYYFILY